MMISELRHGNPCDPARRPEEQACYTLLDSLGVSYDRIDHDPMFTIAACAAVDAALGTPICKNLFLRNSNASQYYLLLIPGDKPFRTKELSAQIQSTRLSFAPEEKMQEYLHVTPGSVTVLGLAFDTDCRVQLLIDRDVTACEWFVCHPCINTSSLRFSTSDLLEKILPAVRHAPRFVTLGTADEKFPEKN
ncbi:MAG: prolyl-tRNA synthetase associated domain-containing protein [Eubacteriales bacterium]